MSDNPYISPNKEPFIIAEMSGNHNGELERALTIIEEAAKAGADAIKFQTYTADTMTLDCDKDDFLISDPDSPWTGRRLHELYTEAHTPWEWHEAMFNKAKECGIVAFSSPFDETSVDFLETFDPPLYKVASFELTYLQLIEKIAKTGKPMIMSTGLGSLEEIERAVETAKNAGATDITLMKCTSAYPADASDSNLVTINDLRERFGVKIGMSDHTLGIGVSVASVAFGAVAIEKHFTTSRDDEGVDSEFSMNPEELKLLKEETRRAWNAIGTVHYAGMEREQNSKIFRRSVWPKSDIKQGEAFTRDNLVVFRPGYGLDPRFLDDMVGKKATRNIERGERLSLDDAA